MTTRRRITCRRELYRLSQQPSAHAAAQATRRAFHDECRDRASASRNKAAELDARVAKIHAASQRRHKEMRAKDALTEQKLTQKAAAKKQTKDDAAAAEMQCSIDAFEAKMAKLGKAGVAGGGSGSGGSSGAGTEADIGTLKGAARTPLSQAQRLKMFLSDKECIQQEAEVRCLGRSGQRRRIHFAWAEGAQGLQRMHERRCMCRSTCSGCTSGAARMCRQRASGV
jgi:hypothetical protein